MTSTTINQGLTKNHLQSFAQSYPQEDILKTDF